MLKWYKIINRLKTVSAWPLTTPVCSTRDTNSCTVFSQHCNDELPQNSGLQQRKCILSFWRPEVWHHSITRVRLSPKALGENSCFFSFWWLLATLGLQMQHSVSASTSSPSACCLCVLSFHLGTPVTGFRVHPKPRMISSCNPWLITSTTILFASKTTFWGSGWTCIWGDFIQPTALVWMQSSWGSPIVRWEEFEATTRYRKTAIPAVNPLRDRRKPPSDGCTPPPPTCYFWLIFRTRMRQTTKPNEEIWTC